MKAIALCLALALGGCMTTGQTSLGLSPKVEETLKAVQTFCRFAPTVSSVIKLVNKYSAVTSALTIADDICLAVSSIPLAEGGSRKIKVRGVVIKGRKI